MISPSTLVLSIKVTILFHEMLFRSHRKSQSPRPKNKWVHKFSRFFHRWSLIKDGHVFLVGIFFIEAITSGWIGTIITQMYMLVFMVLLTTAIVGWVAKQHMTVFSLISRDVNCNLSLSIVKFGELARITAFTTSRMRSAALLLLLMNSCVWQCQKSNVVIQLREMRRRAEGEQCEVTSPQPIKERSSRCFVKSTDGFPFVHEAPCESRAVERRIWCLLKRFHDTVGGVCGRWRCRRCGFRLGFSPFRWSCLSIRSC